MPEFSAAWKHAGLRNVGEIVWQKRYASRQGFTQYRHEGAYLLAKGRPPFAQAPVAKRDGLDLFGEQTAPDRKGRGHPDAAFQVFSKQDDLVCDPFSGSGGTSVAAALTGREYLDIDIDPVHIATAKARLAGVTRFQSGRMAA